jgi:hypothetical protein
MLKEDYVTRMIKDMIKAIIMTILGKRELDYELPSENEKYTSNDFILKQILDLADDGKINEAENVLLTEFAFDDPIQLEIALTFYSHINEYEEDFLENHNYSRQEVSEGIEAVAQRYGYTGLMSIMGGLS